MKVTVNMPQMSCCGLSENWLFRYCGDLFWADLCSAFGVTSRDLKSDAGLRMYPAFVAISARYSLPISQVVENTELEARCEIARFGSSFFSGTVVLKNDELHLQLRLLTAFVERVRPSDNDLRRATPAGTPRCAELQQPPDLLLTAQALRKKQLEVYRLDDATGIPLDGAPTGFSLPFEPDPFVDFNGARLLYFASYPTISDRAERKLMNSRAAAGATDWALRSGTMARDIYYHANLGIGETVQVHLAQMPASSDERAVFRSVIVRDDDTTMADVFTVKAIAEPSFQA